ncbi:hypothetical protein [Mucilaginibacter sp.]|uniref:hypothetical protein n=1 Tax=Mucilaginibacter sp. TaxID=1882438 RepID=UPI003D1304BF
MKPEEELHSFPYSETVDGVEHNYRITQNMDRYGVEKDGVVIAELSHDDGWKQLSGEKLSKERFESICNHIESHFD